LIKIKIIININAASIQVLDMLNNILTRLDDVYPEETKNILTKRYRNYDEIRDDTIPYVLLYYVQ